MNDAKKSVEEGFKAFADDIDEINEVIDTGTVEEVGKAVRSHYTDAMEDDIVKMDRLRNLSNEKDYYRGYDKRYERSKKLLEARLKKNLKPYSDLCNAFVLTISVMCCIMLCLQTYYLIVTAKGGMSIFLHSQMLSARWTVFLWIEIGLALFQKHIHKAIVLHKQLKRAKKRRDTEFELFMDHLNGFDYTWTNAVMAHMIHQWLKEFDKRCTLTEEYNEVVHKYNNLVKQLGVQEMDIAGSVGD